MTELVTVESIEAATARIRPHIVRTPMVPSPGLSDRYGAEVHLKAELLQPTGSFKVRGGFNKALSLTEAERERGLIAFSAGNHAMSVAYVAGRIGVPVTVCMPAGAVRFKIDAVRDLGATVELVEGNLVEHVMRRQSELGATLVHPFDDPAIVAGHASVGLEIIEDLPDVDTVIVPVGGGGLISGAAAGIKLRKPGVRIIGVEPDGADVVSRSRAAGEPVPYPGPRSLADGLAAPVTGALNLAHIEAHVDEMVVIPESTIRPAWRDLLSVTKLAGEPAAAVGIAALDAGLVEVEPGETVCLIVSGGNADFELLAGG